MDSELFGSVEHLSPVVGAASDKALSATRQCSSQSASDASSSSGSDKLHSSTQPASAPVSASFSDDEGTSAS